MPVELNPEQRLAVEHDSGSLVLSAGAGSGKTRVLVERYLRHLHAGGNVRDLVAFTFTEKAAREMRLRIRDQVSRILREASEDDRPRWKLIDQDLETAAIDTIHGYCTKLLQKHRGPYVVLDASQSATLANETAISTLQTLLVGASPLTTDLHELVVLYGWPAVVGAVEDLLSHADVSAWRAFAAKTPTQIAAEWQDRAAGFVPELIADTIATNKEIQKLKTIVPVTAAGDVELGMVLGELENLRNGIGSATELFERAKIGAKHVQAKKNFGADNYPHVKAGYEAIRALLTGGVQELTQVLENLTAAVVVSLRMVRVALHVQEAYAARKATDLVLDFDDLIAEAFQLLRDDDLVRAGVQMEVQHLLLDELQDTDPLQMEIVKLVLGERFASGGLFAVGDAKQSIYRFRGADVTLFERLRATLPQRFLVRNYRSRPGIIRFVNTLCKAWFPNEALLETVREESGTPTVEFLWTRASKDDDRSEWRYREATTLAKRIDELIEGGTRPGDIVLLFRALSNVSIYEDALRTQGIEYYLVGGRAFFAQQEVYDLANLLRAIENPFDAVAVVGTLRSPFCGLSDDAVVAICLGAPSPWEGLNAEELPRLPAAEREATQRAKERLTAWRQVKDSLPIARLVQRILADTEYDGALLFEPLGERKLANLWKLQEIARDFDANGFRLAEFVEHLENLVARQPREEQAATVPEQATHIVRIMSIHQAKGLEFPVVIVPDLGADVRSLSISAVQWLRSLGAVAALPPESDEEDVGYSDWPCTLAKSIERVAESQESLRVLYVACTRAEELLILSTSISDEESLEPRGEGMEALARAYDLESGQPSTGGEPVVVKFVGEVSQPAGD